MLTSTVESGGTLRLAGHGIDGGMSGRQRMAATLFRGATPVLGACGEKSCQASSLGAETLGCSSRPDAGGDGVSGRTQSSQVCQPAPYCQPAPSCPCIPTHRRALRSLHSVSRAPCAACRTPPWAIARVRCATHPTLTSRGRSPPSTPTPRASAACSTLSTPAEAVGHLLHVHFFLQSFRELILPQPSDLENPASLTERLSLNELDEAIAEGDSIVVHDLHCVLLTLL